MSLATRCPACGTVFRVVSDQLKVSEGWVRCGRCTEVFNAGQRLFELEPGVATPAPPPDRPAAEVHRLPLRGDAATAPVVARMGASLAPPSAAPEPASQPIDDEPQAIEAPAEPALASATPAADENVDADPADRADVPQPEVLPAPAPPGAVDAPHEPPLPAPVEPAREPDTVGPEPGITAAAPDTAATPEFIRRADRAARWRQPSRRGPLAAVALLLLLLLVGQIGVHYRDPLAAGWPGTKPWLEAACRAVGCRIEAPRRIDSLNVDSSGLLRLQDSALYRLSLVVQNKASTPVRMPAVDLVLTDGQGQTMVRRVLSAAELGHGGDSLPAGGEASLQATLDLGERRVAGYTVELFYP
jgi:predicted Zn finger-like uncharacterized protein